MITAFSGKSDRSNSINPNYNGEEEEDGEDDAVEEEYDYYDEEDAPEDDPHVQDMNWF